VRLCGLQGGIEVSLRLVDTPMQQQRLCQPELDARTKVPIAKFGDERERLFEECDSALAVVLVPCDEGQPGPVPCLPFEIA